MQKTRVQSSSTYLTRRRWTAEDAKEALADLERSGLPLGAFAVREGLDAQRLWRWRRRLASSAEPPLFEEVVQRETAPAPDGAKTPCAERERFEIVLGSGRVVRVPDAFDAGALRRLLSVVDEVRPC